MCIRCQKVDAPEPLGLCTACVVNARLEVFEGLGRLERYLAAWAAFADWLRVRGREA
jgi:hypothetical protein